MKKIALYVAIICLLSAPLVYSAGTQKFGGAETLSTVTGRGASTSTKVTLSGNVAVSGNLGTIDNATIGGTTPAAGTFTTITGGAGGFTVDADGDVKAKSLSRTSLGNIDNMTIGATTRAAGSFTTLDFNAVDNATESRRLLSAEGVLTNSAGLLSALSDETGTGLSVFNTSPAFTTDLHSTAAGGTTLGTALLPFSDIYFAGTSGTPATNHFKITGASTTGEITLTVPSLSKTLAANDGSNWTFTSQAIGDIPYATSTTAFGVLADVAAGSYLRSGGTSTAPLWSTLTLPNTGTAYTLPVYSATNVMTELASAGTTGQILKAASGAIPAWTTETYAAPGASGNIMISDGTNWTSSKAVAPIAIGTIDNMTIGGTTAAAGTFTTISAGAAGFSVDADGDITVKSLTVGTGQTLLSSTVLALNADGNTTIYTVPVGKNAIPTHAILIAAGDAGTTTLTIGQAGALTDFLGTQTLSAVDAAGDAAILMPVPNATPVIVKRYATGTVVKAVVGSQAGAAGNTLLLFGYLY